MRPSDCTGCNHLRTDGSCELHRYIIWWDCGDFEPLEVR